MKEFSLNFKEGMFLGKQELERQNLISQFMLFSLQRLWTPGTSTKNTVSEGLFNLKKLRVVATSSSDGVAFSVVPEYNYLGEEYLGRMVVGRTKSGNYIALPVGDGTNLLKKEAFLAASSYSGYTGTYYIYFNHAETNYENTTITISANGTGVIAANDNGLVRGIMDMFRQGSQGRFTKIKTEGNQVLTVQSVDTTTNTITFAESSVVAETGARFMFVHTLSPLVSETVAPLYTYPSCGIYLSQSKSDDNNGERFCAGSIVFASGAVSSVTIEDVIGVSYPWLEIVGYKEITEGQIADGAVDADQLAPDAVTEEKIADDAVTTDKIEDGSVTKDKLAADAISKRTVLRYSIVDWDTPITLSSSALGKVVVIECLAFASTSGGTDVPIIYGAFSDLTTAALKNAKLLELQGQSGVIYCHFPSLKAAINESILLLFGEPYPDSSIKVYKDNVQIKCETTKTDVYLRFDYTILSDGLWFESIKTV